MYAFKVSISVAQIVLLFPPPCYEPRSEGTNVCVVLLVGSELDQVVQSAKEEFEHSNAGSCTTSLCGNDMSSHANTAHRGAIIQVSCRVQKSTKSSTTHKLWLNLVNLVRISYGLTSLANAGTNDNWYSSRS